MLDSVGDRVGNDILADTVILSTVGGGVFAGSRFVDVGALPVSAPGFVALVVTVYVGFRLSRQVGTET